MAAGNRTVDATRLRDPKPSNVSHHVPGSGRLPCDNTRRDETCKGLGAALPSQHREGAMGAAGSRPQGKKRSGGAGESSDVAPT